MSDALSTAARPRPARLAVAVVVSIALVVSAPYIGLIRGQLRAAFPGRFGLIVNAAIALILTGAFLGAVARIRARRVIRYAALASAVILGVIFARYNASGTPDTIVVERFHFVEYGLITFLFYRAWRHRDDTSVLVLPALAAFVVGTADEALQWFVPGRVGELRDVFLNGAAIGCGLLFGVGADPPGSFAPSLRAGSITRVGAALAITVLALAAFVDVVHLGHLISGVEIGSFKSRYSAAELDGLSRERADRWRQQPPQATPPRFSQEDQYLAEALWHVEKRNADWARGDFAAAWEENRILERFFAPALGLGHRWPAAQREDAARRVSTDPRPFTSDANKYPIYLWRRDVFWGFVLFAAIGILVMTIRVDRRRTVLH